MWDTTFETPDSSFCLYALHYKLNYPFHHPDNIDINQEHDLIIRGQFKKVTCSMQRIKYYQYDTIDASENTITNIYNATEVVFNSTAGLRTSDSILPKHIKYPFFVVISEIFKENSGEV